MNNIPYGELSTGLIGLVCLFLSFFKMKFSTLISVGYKLVCTIALMSVFCVSYAQIYKWTDSQGNVHFSDNPHEGALELKIPDAQSYSPPLPQKQQTEPNPKKRIVEDEIKPHAYNRVVITQPENGATIRNNQGSVVVAVELEPELLPEDKVQLIFDGALVGEPQTTLSFQLNGVNRGTHTIAVQVISSNGNLLNATDPITIYMHRPRINQSGKPSGG